MSHFVSLILKDEDRSRTVLAVVAAVVSLSVGIAGTVATLALR